MSGRRSISENLDTVFEYMEEGNEEDGLDLLEELLDNGMSPETMSDWKLLQYAIAIDNPDMVQILIEHNVDPFRIDDGEGMPLEIALREGRDEIAELLNDYITVIMIQRNRRRNIKNRKIKTLRNRLIRNKQKLITAKHPDLDFDTSRILGETLHNMPVNPEVYTRMNQERRAEEERAQATIRRRQMENTRMANYLDTLDQFGGTRSKSRSPDKVELAQNENMARFLEGLEEFDSDVIGLDDLPIDTINLDRMNCRDRLSYCGVNRKTRDHCNSEPTLSKYIKPCRKQSKFNKTKRKTIEVSKRLSKKYHDDLYRMREEFDRRDIDSDDDNLYD